MAPETFDGRRSVHSDIWAVGLILYQLLSGAYPFPRKNMAQLIGAICNREPDPLPAYVPAPLREVVGRALAKEASDRFESAAEMRAALATAAAACPAGVAVAGAGVVDAAAAVPSARARRDDEQTRRASASLDRMAATRSGPATESASNVPLLVTSRAQRIAERPQLLAAAALAVILAVLGFYVYSSLVPATLDSSTESASASTGTTTRTAGATDRTGAASSPSAPAGTELSAPSPAGAANPFPTVAGSGPSAPSPGPLPPSYSAPMPEPPPSVAPASSGTGYAGTWEYSSPPCTGTYRIAANGTSITSISGVTNCGGGGASWTAYEIHQQGNYVMYKVNWQGDVMECKIEFTSSSEARKVFRFPGKNMPGGGGSLRRVG
jgi:serine/threonine-protein kinase